MWGGGCAGSGRGGGLDWGGKGGERSGEVGGEDEVLFLGRGNRLDR